MFAQFTKILRLFAFAASLGAGLWAIPAHATFHLYQITEIYSSADGSVQYVEIFTSASGQNFPLNTSAATLMSTGGSTQSYRVPANYPSGDTTNTHVLFATQAFASLGIVTPDYIIPAGFLSVSGGSINYAGVDTVTFTALPTNGMAIARDGTQKTPAPTNFAGQTGSLQTSFTPQAGFWWNPAEPGRGYVIEVHSNNNLFIGGFMYAASGEAIWYASGPSPMLNSTTYTGSWLQYSGGQTLTGPYQAPSAVTTNVGPLTIQFTSATDGMLTLPNAVQIPITRFPF
jgi:serralysin